VTRRSVCAGWQRWQRFDAVHNMLNFRLLVFARLERQRNLGRQRTRRYVGRLAALLIGASVTGD
jgi:hypothetical protein